MEELRTLLSELDNVSSRVYELTNDLYMTDKISDEEAAEIMDKTDDLCDFINDYQERKNWI